jgi:hypothetical protein
MCSFSKWINVVREAVANEDFALHIQDNQPCPLFVSILVCPLPLLRQGASVLKNPSLSFPLVLFTQLSGEREGDLLRSEALPPMGVRAAMQFRLERREAILLRTGAAELAKHARRGMERHDGSRPADGKEVRSNTSMLAALF